MQVPVYNLQGEVIKNIDVSDYLFAVPFNEAVVHQTMVRQRANMRQGTSDTKTRGEVNYSGGKLFRQKGTGNARAGSRRSPIRRGGGVTFGPHPRSYRQEMPKKMRRLALRCMLSTKAVDSELKVVEGLDFEKPSTREMLNILTALDVKSSVLVVTDKAVENVVKSARNLRNVKTSPAGLMNVIDLLSHKNLLMTEAAVRKAEDIWGEKAVQEVSSSEPV